MYCAIRSQKPPRNRCLHRRQALRPIPMRIMMASPMRMPCLRAKSRRIYGRTDILLSRASCGKRKSAGRSTSSSEKEKSRMDGCAIEKTKLFTSFAIACAIRQLEYVETSNVAFGPCHPCSGYLPLRSRSTSRSSKPSKSFHFVATRIFLPAGSTIVLPSSDIVIGSTSISQRASLKAR